LPPAGHPTAPTGASVAPLCVENPDALSSIGAVAARVLCEIYSLLATRLLGFGRQLPRVVPFLSGNRLVSRPATIFLVRSFAHRISPKLRVRN